MTPRFAEVSPILEELSSALIPLAQHIADELMREDAGLNEKNHGRADFSCKHQVETKNLTPYNSRENSFKIVSREFFTHSGFPWHSRFPGSLLFTIHHSESEPHVFLQTLNRNGTDLVVSERVDLELCEQSTRL